MGGGRVGGYIGWLGECGGMGWYTISFSDVYFRTFVVFYFFSPYFFVVL